MAWPGQPGHSVRARPEEVERGQGDKWPSQGSLVIQWGQCWRMLSEGEVTNGQARAAWSFSEGKARGG